jgi:hypothetical protein
VPDTPAPGLVPAADADLPEFWASLRLPGVIDVHVHAMPDRLQEAVWAYFDDAGPLLGRPWPVRYRMDLAERTRRLHGFGVIGFTSLLYPHKPGMAATLNEWAAQFAAATPGCIQTATFFAEPSAGQDVARAIEAGARVFKAHVQVGGYDPRDRDLDAAWGNLADAEVPVVVHCGGGPVPTQFTGPDVFAEVMARHPRLSAVVAHLGWPDFAEFFDLVAKYPRMRLDTSSVFTEFTEAAWPFPRDQVHRLRDLGDRILFGSDFPTIPYAYAEAVAGIVRLGFDEDWMRAVFHDNAAALWPELTRN